MTKRLGAEAALLGCALFVVACALPWIGLFRGHLGTSLFQSYGDAVVSGHVPYRDFSLEYPPAALPAFVVPSFGPAHAYDSWFMAFEAASGLATVALVGLLSRSRLAAAFCALAPLALGPLTLHRYDLWATALATAGLAAALTRRPTVGAGLLGLGAAAKVFPLVLLPTAGRRAAGWFAAGAALAITPFLVLAPGGVRFAFDQQLGRALQLESLGSSALLVVHAAGAYTPHVVFGRGSWNLDGALPDALAAVQTVLEMGTVVTVWVLYLRGERTRVRLLAAAAAAVAVWIAFGKVLSPQFLVWLLPLVALLGAWRERFLLLVAFGLTQAVYPDRYDELVALHRLPIALLGLRNLVLLALAASLIARLVGDRVPEEVAREREGAEPRDPVRLERRERHGPDGVPGLEPGSRE
jgi:Glycosyltransferase family 87